MYILIDIGGTKTRIAVARTKDNFGEPDVFKTPQDFAEWLAAVHRSTDTLRNDESLKGVVLGVPGTFTENGVILRTPNLPHWQGIPLREHLEKLFHVDIILHNDTALVGLGEAVYGAGKDHTIVAYLTISTGVNGVRIVDGTIDRSTHGFEIGHSIIDVEHEKDVESIIGGGALERQFGKPSHEVQDVGFWEKISRYAGVFSANTTMYWSPSIIIIGGPVMNDLHVDIIEKEAKRHLYMYNEYPVFTRGTLKDFGGLYGALVISAYTEDKH
jgi:predicted NBD/HSP70 family sugar kinase